MTPTPTRYETLLHAREGIPRAMAQASRTARTTTPVPDEHHAAIRDVATGVAAPILTGYVIWLLREAESRGLTRLCFLSRDAQVLYEIARVIAPRLGIRDVEMRYVYSSRRTWSLAASDPYQLDGADWLFNSFIRSNALDVCARTGLDPEIAAPLFEKAGVSLDPEVRADTPEQNAALRRFVALPEVAEAMAPRIGRMRELVRDYAVQEGMASRRTGLVDAGWTGRMVAALHAVLRADGLDRPHAYFWGHERRASGGSVEPEFLSSYMYNTDGPPGVQWRVPDNPYIVETFCMSDHSIVSGYARRADGTVVAELSQDNSAVTEWGFATYRAGIAAFVRALAETDEVSHKATSHAEVAEDVENTEHSEDAAGDVRPALSEVLRAFWLDPTESEARAWGAYPYDSDPLGRSTLPLARPFTPEELADAGLPGFRRGDRAWLPGSLAISGSAGARAREVLAGRLEGLGSPAKD